MILVLVITDEPVHILIEINVIIVIMACVVKIRSPLPLSTGIITCEQNQVLILVLIKTFLVLISEIAFSL